MSESVPTVTIPSAADLKVIKKAVRATLPSLGSGHAGECIARGLQRSTYDGLVFELASGPITTLTDSAAFARRAAELGYTETSRTALEAAFLAGVKGFTVEKTVLVPGEREAIVALLASDREVHLLPSRLAATGPVGSALAQDLRETAERWLRETAETLEISPRKVFDHFDGAQPFQDFQDFLLSADDSRREVLALLDKQGVALAGDDREEAGWSLARAVSHLAYDVAEAAAKAVPARSPEQIGRDHARADLGYDARLLAIDDHMGLPRPNPGSVRKAQEVLLVTDDWKTVAEKALEAAGYEPDEDGDFDEDLLERFSDGMTEEVAKMAAEIAEGEQERLQAVVARLSFDDTVEALGERRLDPVAIDFAALGRKHAAELVASGEIDFAEFGDEDEFEVGIENDVDFGRSSVSVAAGDAGYDDAFVRTVVREYVSALTGALRAAWAASRVESLDEKTRDLLKELKSALDATDNEYTRIGIVADRLAEQAIDMVDLGDYVDEDPRISMAEGVESWFDGSELKDLGNIEIWGPYLGFDQNDEKRLRKAVVEATASLVEERLENDGVDPVLAVGTAVGSLLAGEDEDLDIGTPAPDMPRL